MNAYELYTTLHYLKNYIMNNYHILECNFSYEKFNDIVKSITFENEKNNVIKLYIKTIDDEDDNFESGLYISLRCDLINYSEDYTQIEGLHSMKDYIKHTMMKGLI